MALEITSLRLPAEWRVRADMAARMLGLSRSAWVRRAIEEQAERDLAALSEPGKTKPAAQRGRRGHA